MSCLVEWLRSPLWPRAAAVALMAIGVAACSGDTSRFNDSPFSSKGPEATGSIQQAQAAPAGRVESRPLPPQTAQTSGAPYGASPTSLGTAGGGRGMASYSPATARSGSAPAYSPGTARAGSAPATEVTGAVSPSRPTSTGNWSWDGGTPITVGPGETIDSIARRHGVPASVIISANNLTSPAAIHAGQQLVIPRYSSPIRTASAVPNIAPVAATPPVAATTPAGNPGVHVVAPGETLSRISRLYGKPTSEIAKANNIALSARLNVGDRLVIPGVRTSAIQSKATPVVADAKPAAAAPPEAEVQSASVFSQVSDPQAAKDATKTAEATGALPKFRWPANGRVTTGFGPTPNGQHNDGINIAVPENTPVKAAEDGVVAYAGNELKGYGNLVLVRHPNGYVTAYAHAKELLVKRGDQVKRGQMIARSGQSGNVNAPQLHFQIRKGATPQDPTKFLNGA
jgi:murein DD-endopeptidase MepM/ murein hydrolase activator NlpD